MPYPTRSLVLGAALLCGLAAVPSASAQMQRPNQPDRTVTKAERAQVVEGLSRALKEKYVFPDVADRMAARLAERLGTAYDTVTSAKALSQLLTDDLRDIAHDKHLNIFYSAEPIPTAPSGPPPATPGGPDRMAAINYGFEKVERLAGNVGYLKFNGFMDPSGAAGDVAAAAMAFVAGTDALIIDVRDNGGGSPGMVAFLCTYLFEGRPVHLNDLYWRATDATQQYWTLAYVPGRRYVNKDVYVLTSGRTFSAAEEFTNNLKTLKRATVVGETTGGGANPGGMERLSDHFGAFVPSGRAINPITKTNWEGSGVAPDLAVPASAALDAAYRDALTKLAAKQRGPRLDQETKDALTKVSNPPKPED